MRKEIFQVRMAALLLGLGIICAPFSANGQDYSGTWRVSGGIELGAGRPAYRLEISAESGSVLSPQALLVYAEPSHTLLLAHVDPVYQDLDSYRDALALTKGTAKGFQHSLALPYHPLTDRRVVVVLKMDDGQEWIVADAMVNLRRFDFSTSVAIGAGPGEVTSAAKYNHCCSGPLCTRICIECETVSFSCNMIDCDIQCGHDLTWPPRY